MVKSEIRSLILNILPRFDKTGKYTPRFVDACIEKVLNGMYNDVFRADPLALQRYTKGFGYVTPLTISFEATSGLYYTNYPTGISIVPFTDKASGVRRVSTPIQGGFNFFPMDSREMDFINGSNIDLVTAKIGYAVTPTRVEFYKMSTSVIATGIRMDLIIPFSNYADTDVVLIPEEADAQGTTFIDKVLKILGAVQKVDLLDSNSDIETKQNTGQ
jgi:hypothetical protein